MRLLVGLALGAILSASPVHAGFSCLVLADPATGKVLKQEGPCDQRVTPASTFKIAISLMGFDSGFLKDEHTPLLATRLGYAGMLPSSYTAVDPTIWIKYSVVWYSQQVTQSLGEKRFQQDVTAFHYGNEDVSGDPGKHDGLTQAWLSSSLQISPLEQARFLEKLVRHELPVSARAIEMTEHITLYTTLPGGWEIHGKTGTGFPREPDGSDDHDHGYGWFVGWATKGSRTLVFARLVQYDSRQSAAGPRTRDDFLKQLLALLNEADSAGR